MAVVATAPEETSLYTATFLGHIARAAEHMRQTVQRADSLLALADCAQALHILPYALKQPQAWSATGELLLMLAPRLEQAGYRDEWIPLLEEGVTQSHAYGDRRTAAELELHLGLLYQVRSRYEAASTTLRSSAAHFASFGDNRGQARALTRLGYVARLRRQYAEATRLIEEALSLLEAADPAREFCYFVQGVIALDERDWQRAADHFQRALALCEQQGERRKCAQRLLNLVICHYEQENYAEASDCARRAMALFEQVQDPVQRAVTQMNLGNVYLLWDAPEKALELYAEAEPVLRRVYDDLHLTKLYTNQGMAFGRLQCWQEAEGVLQAAIRRWQQLGDVHFLVDTLDELSQVYQAQARYGEAITILEQAAQWVAQIKDEPGWSVLEQSVTTHLGQARANLA